MFLQHQRDSTSQTGHAVFESWDETRSGTGRKGLTVDLGLDDAGESLPRSRQVSDYHDPFRRKTYHDHSHPASQMMRHRFEGLPGTLVTLIGAAQQIRKRQTATVMRAGFEIISERG